MFAAVPSPALGLCYNHRTWCAWGSTICACWRGTRIVSSIATARTPRSFPEALYRYGNRPPALDTPPGFSEGAWRYCVPGDGAVNWAAVAYALEQAGYDGVVSIELEDARYWGTLEREQQGIRRAQRHLAQQFL